MSPDDIATEIRRLAAMMQSRGETPEPFLALIQDEAKAADRVLRALLRTKPATDENWGEFQMAQGAVAALNRLGLRLEELLAPPAPRLRRPPSEV